MKYSQHNLSQLHGMQHQKGVALFAVIMILILISLLGAMSMKVSNMNQRISQNSQASKLLKQSADVPVSIMLKGSDSGGLEKYMQPYGPLGFLATEGNETSEYVFCYTPQKQEALYSNSNYLVHKKTATGVGTQQAGVGYCDLSANSHTSARGVVATQVSVTRPNQTITSSSTTTLDTVIIEPFEASERGTDTNSINRKDPVYYRTYTASVLPAMSAANSDATIKGCLQKTTGGLTTMVSGATDDLHSCLENQEVPNRMQVQDFIYSSKINRS